jgi:hypothetical protein
MTQDHFEAITVKVPPDFKEEYKEVANSQSGTARMLLKTWVEAVEEHDLDEEPKQMNLAILQSYKNAIEKNIESLKMQRDKLQESIDDIQDDEEEDEILVEVDLKLKRKHL